MLSYDVVDLKHLWREIKPLITDMEPGDDFYGTDNDLHAVTYKRVMIKI